MGALPPQPVGRQETDDAFKSAGFRPVYVDRLDRRTYGLAGNRATITTACSSSATSIGYGFDLIRSGDQQVVIVGGSESLSELTFAGFNALRVMSPEPCRPFDRNRRGLSLGEGSAILILEAFDHARKRGAAILAEVLGYAINSDAYHMTSPDPAAKGMRRVMAQALARADVTADQIDYINAHGTGTQINDATETIAIKKVLGVHQPQPVRRQFHQIDGRSLFGGGGCGRGGCNGSGPATADGPTDDSLGSSGSGL